jgi:hypothetical protein
LQVVEGECLNFLKLLFSSLPLSPTRCSPLRLVLLVTGEMNLLLEEHVIE